MPERSTRAGPTRWFLKGSAALALIAALVGWAATARSPDDLIRDVREAPPTPTELEGVLRSLDLDPEALAVCGVAIGDIDAVVRSVARAMVTHRRELSRIGAEIQAFGREQAQLARQIRGVTDGREAREQYGDFVALQRLAAAERDAIHDEIVASAVAHWPDSVRAVHATLRMNRRAGWEVPLPYLTVARSEAQWVHLREALAGQRFAREQGNAVPFEIEVALIEAESDPVVARGFDALDDSSMDEIRATVSRAVDRYASAKRKRAAP